MTQGTSQSNADAYAEAERWFARLIDANATDADRTSFERWRAAAPEHASAYREIAHIWALSREAARHPSLLELGERAANAQPSQRYRARRWVPALATAAACLAVLVVGLYWLRASAPPHLTTYRTTIGQQRSIALVDGSTVLLDTDSEIAVRYSGNARSVDLLHGRAQFHVHHNAKEPFTVHAGAGVLTDIGTTFQVEISGTGDVDVVLLKGSVNVAVADSSATLVGGQALAYDDAGITRRVHAADVRAALGWPHGNIVAQDWRLPKLLAAMNRYSTVKLVIGDPALRTLRISGTFRVGDQKALVQILEAGWPIYAEPTTADRIKLLPSAREASHPCEGYRC